MYAQRYGLRTLWSMETTLLLYDPVMDEFEKLQSMGTKVRLYRHNLKTLKYHQPWFFKDASCRKWGRGRQNINT